MVTRADLENELKDAMRTQDVVRKRTLRMVLSDLKLAEVEKGGMLDDTALLALLQKEIKSREETISEASKANRTDIIKDTEAEIGIIRSFLPVPLSNQALQDLVLSVIAEVGATTPADMGKVMKELTPRLQGRASGKDASDMVRRLLQGT
jgi:uncharacterized protein